METFIVATFTRMLAAGIFVSGSAVGSMVSCSFPEGRICAMICSRSEELIICPADASSFCMVLTMSSRICSGDMRVITVGACGSPVLDMAVEYESGTVFSVPVSVCDSSRTYVFPLSCHMLSAVTVTVCVVGSGSSDCEVYLSTEPTFAG